MYQLSTSACSGCFARVPFSILSAQCRTFFISTFTSAWPPALLCQQERSIVMDNRYVFTEKTHVIQLAIAEQGCMRLVGTVLT